MNRRHRGSGASSLLAAALALMVGAVVPGAAQVLVDDFSTAQGLLTVPPGTSASSVVNGGGIQGSDRAVAIELVDGAGPVTLQVAAGDLVFDVATGSTGSALVTWDGDTDPDNLDPTGLGGVDFTAGGVSAFRLRAGATQEAVDAVIEVWTDGANASAGALRIPVGAPRDLVLAFSELAILEGAGADFTSLGAITLRLRATGVAPSTGATIERFDAVGPTLAATKVDALTADGDMDGLADPGDTLTYTITITNPGGEALTVDLADAVDGNTTLVPGSVRATPIAKGDQYRTVGNVSLQVDGTPWPALLANDDDPDGDTISVTAFDATSVHGGTVSLDDAATGAFTYVPPPGFRGVDTFTYTAEDDDGDTAVGKATVLVEGIVWFVDNTNTGCGTPPCGAGTQADPFATLKQAEAASQAGDVIRVRQGDGTHTGHDQGWIAKAGQRLVGGAADLVLGGNLIEAGTGRSVHSHAAGNVIDLAGDNVVEGVRLNPTTGHGLAGTGSSNVQADDVVIDSASGAGGVSLTNHTGGFTFSSSMITSTVGTSGVAVAVSGGSGTFDFTGSPISHDGGGLIHVQNTTGGATFDFTGSNPELANGTDDGILLSNNTGGASFTFDAIGDVGTGAGNGIRIAASGTVNLETIGNVAATGGAALDVSGTTVMKIGGPGPITVASLASTGGTVGVSLNAVAPAVTVTGTTTLNGAAGIALQSSGATAFTGQATVTATAGAGIAAANTGTVSVLDATSTVSSTGGPALEVTNTTLGMTFASLSAAPGAGGRGVSLVGVTGTVTTNGGTVTGGTAGTAFHVSGGAPTVTHGGTVTQNNAQRVVNVESTSGGSVGFGGKVTGGASSLGVRIHDADGDASFADLDLGTSGARMTSTGITLSGGSAGTFTFADTQVFTNGATGFDANNGGTMEVTGTGNRVDSTSARAITLEGGTTIGANGVTFERVDASGSDHGVRLANAGTGFTITGDGPDGTDGSGGVLSSMTQRAIEAIQTGGLTLRNVDIDNGATTNGADPTVDSTNCGSLETGSNVDCHAAVHLESVSDVLLDNVDIDGSVQQGINGRSVTNLRIENSRIENVGNQVREDGVHLFNMAGTLVLLDSVIDFPEDNGVRLYNNAGTLNATVLRTTISNNKGTNGNDGFSLEIDGGTTTLLVDDSDLIQLSRDGVDGVAEGTGVLNVTVQGSRFNNSDGFGGVILANDGNAVIRARIANNTIADNVSNAINLFSAGDADLDATIIGNTIEHPNVANIGFGVRIIQEENSDVDVHIEDNDISDVQQGILARARSVAPGNPQQGTLDVAVRDTDVANSAIGIQIDAGVSTETHENVVCLNTSTGAGAGNNDITGTSTLDWLLNQRSNAVLRIQGLGAATVPAHVQANNVGTPNVFTVGTAVDAPAACDAPVAVPLPPAI